MQFITLLSTALALAATPAAAYWKNQYTDMAHVQGSGMAHAAGE